MDTQQKRTRRVLVAFGAIFLGAVAAFVVTMSMTTSYPSVPAPPSLARPVVGADLASAQADVVERAPPEGATGDTPATDTPGPPAPVETAAGEGGRQARGGVLVDDGAAPRSTGSLGVLAKEDVKAGVGAVKDKVRDCYERALAIDPALAGTVKVAFTLESNDDGKGVVTKGEVADSDMNSLFFEACVLQEIAKAEFKAPGGGGVVNVTYPFTFANDDAGDAGP